MRAKSAIAIFTAAAIASIVYAGCASHRCDYAEVKCQYVCQRGYETCELRGNDERYCRNEMRYCWEDCGATRTSCHSIL
jgi:hypothetical protein